MKPTRFRPLLLTKQPLSRALSALPQPRVQPQPTPPPAPAAPETKPAARQQPPPAAAAQTVPLKPMPGSSKYRLWWDFSPMGGNFATHKLGLNAYFQTLRERHGSDVFAVDFGDGNMPITGLCDPNDFMTVLRSEWSFPVGAAATSWPMAEFYRVSNYDLTAKDEDRSAPFGVMHGPEWRKGRHFVQREIFAQETIEKYVPELARISSQTIPHLDKRGGQVVLRDFFNNLSFELVARVVLGRDLGLLGDKQDDLTKNFVAAALGTFEHTTTLSFMNKEKGKKTKEWKEFVHALGKVNELGKIFVDQTFKEGTDSIVYRLRERGKMSDARLSTEMQGILGAGVDTTSSVMQQMVYSLARHPHAQDKLREEVARVVGDGEITAEKLQQLSYMKAVNREQHRLYFVVASNVRQEPHDVQLENGVRIPAGSLIIYSMWPFSMDEKLMNGDPLLFLPERWLNKNGEYDRIQGGGVRAGEGDLGEKETGESAGPSPSPGERLGRVHNYIDTNVEGRPRGVEVFAPSYRVKHVLAQTPFGAGPRVCLGSRLATLEVFTALAELIRNYDFLPPNKHSTTKQATFAVPSPDPEIVFRKRDRVLTAKDYEKLDEMRAKFGGDISKCPVMH